jgi:outer membrane protein assembly factor BamB
MTAPPAPLRSLNCPNCGAPLDFPEARASVHCRFCGSIVERSDDEPTPDDESHALKIDLREGRITVEGAGSTAMGARRYVIKMQSGQPMVIDAGQTAQAPTSADVTYTNVPAPTRARPASSGAGCLGTLLTLALTLGVPLVIILAVTPGVGAVFSQLLSGNVQEAVSNVQTLGTNISVERSAALIPSTNDAPPDILVLTRQQPLDGGNATSRVVALNGASPALLWQSEPLGSELYETPLLATNERVIVLNKARLIALRRGDGAIAWEAPLSDEVSLNTCRDCVRLIGDKVFALSDDGTLQAFEAATGRSLWTFQGIQDSPRGLYVLDGRPAFMDRNENTEGLLYVFDPASGARQTFRPECTSDPFFGPRYADWTTPLFFAPNGDFYLVFGWPALCLQRFDATTMQPVWSTVSPREGNVQLQSGSAPLITERALYFANDKTLFSADAATGELRELLTDNDYRFTPLEAFEDVLVALAVRQRGSQRNEVWVVDTTTGERRWALDLGEDAPVGETFGYGSIITNDATMWTWRATARGLQILRFYRAPDSVSHALRYQTYDWQTGQGDGQKEKRLGVDTIILTAPNFMLWRNEMLWMEMDGHLLGFDAASGEITYRWP